MKKIVFSIVVAALCSFGLRAEVVYKASLFGCMSDGVTNNTASIQTAINTISQQGGGTLHFYVGRYLTGTVYLKNNVIIVLHEGAVLVGVPSVYDYSGPAGAPKGLIVAEGQKNVGVIGAYAETHLNQPELIRPGMGGVIQGWGGKVMASLQGQQQKGYLKESVAEAAPALLSFSGCTGVRVEGLNLQGAAGDVQVYTKCTGVRATNQLVDSKETASSRGIVFSDCNGIIITDNYFDVSGKVIQSAGNSTMVTSSNNKTRTGKVAAVSK